jgi:hypothetical protein
MLQRRSAQAERLVGLVLSRSGVPTAQSAQAPTREKLLPTDRITLDLSFDKHKRGGERKTTTPSAENR